MSTSIKSRRLPAWARKYIEATDSPFASATRDIHDCAEALRIVQEWYRSDHLPEPTSLEAALDDLKMAVRAAAKKRVE